uniref:acid phosphatase n=1 Tax=Homalodisca liturata TaxID=320908 RepID=A0A1B6IV73_9HEMI
MVVVIPDYACHNALESQDLPIPEFAKNIYPEPLKTLITEFYYASTVGTDDMIKLTEGQLFKELIGLIEAKIDGTLKPNRRMFYYSTHDFTLLSLKAILENGSISTRSYVETGSALIFELHKHLSTDEYYIKLLYIDGGSKDMEPSVINIPACGYPCDFRILKNYTNKYIISDWDEECQVIVNNL